MGIRFASAVVAILLSASSPVTYADSMSSPDAAPPKKPLAIDLYPRVATSPATLRSTVRVQRHKSNRTLRVVLDSPDYYRATDVQLDGDAAPMSHHIEWRAVPAGDYAVRATVLRGDEPRTTAATRVRVFGPTISR